MALALETLSDTQSDLVVLIGRDGTLLDYSGGTDLSALRPSLANKGQSLRTAWPADSAEIAIQCVRRAIAMRGASESRFTFHGEELEIRATAVGPDRARCHVRHSLSASNGPTEQRQASTSRLERRGFLRRFRESMALASLSDMPAAVAVIHIDSIADIAQSFDLTLSERIISLALRRLDSTATANDSALPWYMGQLSHSLLVIVFESGARDAIEQCLNALCDNLRTPLQIGDLSFHLNPYAGAAILGRDANTAKMLLECARSAASEARRAHAMQPQFFSDTMQVRSITRMDLARELSEAITNGDISLRYAGRHDLTSGALHTWVAYLRWVHPLRGEVPPSEFVRIAETTGLAESLSRTALQCLRQDFARVRNQLDARVRFSFGGLRHHLLSNRFVDDVQTLIADNAVSAARLEIRMSERVCLIREPADLRPLVDQGVHIVVDEVGRDAGALRRLANAPLWGMQLDRAWASTVNTDPTAHKLCRAVIAIADAFNLTPIANAVDNDAQRATMLSLGCKLGQGDLFTSSPAI